MFQQFAVNKIKLAPKYSIFSAEGLLI